MAHAGVNAGLRTLTQTVPVTAALLMLLLALAGCQATDSAGSNGQSVAAPAPIARDGAWLGGPEPVSGKLRSGINSWWRTVPAQPSAGLPFELVLRLEDITASDIATAVSTSDGARFADADAARQWLLRAGQPAQVTLRLVAPAGDSYLHVQTQQQGRSSVRSIRLAMPAAPSAASAAARADYAVDVRGEPIVRMRAATP